MKTGTPVTHAIGNVYTNFGFPALLCFELGGRTDGRTDGRTSKTRIAAR